MELEKKEKVAIPKTALPCQRNQLNFMGLAALYLQFAVKNGAPSLSLIPVEAPRLK